MKRNIEKSFDKLIDFVKKQSDIIALYLTGSSGTSSETPRSDIDLVALFKQSPTLFRLLSLEAQFSIILRKERIDLVDLSRSSLEFRFRVIRDGDLLFCRDEIALADYVENVINLYGDYGVALHRFYENYISR